MIVTLVTPRYPPHTGGVETHVEAVATRLTERGHEVTVCTADASEPLPRREHRDGVTVLRHRSLAPGGAFHVSPTITATVRRLESDVVHAHNYHSLPLAAAALGISDERFVVTPHYHGHSASRVRNALLRAYRPLGKRALERATRVVAVSGWERSLLETHFGVDPVVVPNGLEVARFRDATPEHRDRPYLLCVGRLEAYKRVQDAVYALAHLDGYDLVVAGDGPARPALEGLADERGLGDRVTFLGRVPDDRLPGLYAGADAFVHLSRFEAYGLTVAEALAAGTPCVVRAEGALGDWLEYDGVVGVTDATPDAVAAACRRATDATPVSPSVLPTWDDVTDRLLEVYSG
ncbi:glycosyltransferase family 4 protein [Natronobiforma cellulositropha]|uniref:glycosyltransferase family 4 protein n=1 Tax=Natronobiforma cellulositropha TaxID=1679076 RepID=UPI0021D5D1B0|nr:glycosyltransferase family 4 protein [Natronobiforma cellulositropha]